MQTRHRSTTAGCGCLVTLAALAALVIFVLAAIVGAGLHWGLAL